MSNLSNVDWTAVGTAIGAIGLVAGGIWAAWQNRQKVAAQTKAEVAVAGAAEQVADSQKIVYNTLTERVTTLEKDLRALRDELVEERKHSRRLELHIWRLENLMRQAGIEPPAIEAGDPSTKGMTT